MNKEENEKFLAEPPDLPPDGKKAYDLIMAFLRARDLTYMGECRAFYSPQQWKDKKELYGCDSVLIVCHDGGEHADVFNPFTRMGYSYSEQLFQQLQAAGLWMQPCTCWYTAIYPTPSPIEAANISPA